MAATPPTLDATNQPAAPEPTFTDRLLRAFRHRNYRLFFAGQLVSLVGTFLSQVAIAWLVFRLTRSALYLGVIGFAGQIPMLLITPFAGVWADRWNRQRLLVVTQALSMLQSVGLAIVAVAAARHAGSSTHALLIALTVLAAFQGIVNAFDMPARQAFLVQMVEDRADLANAIALNSTMVHGARLLGPAAAGFLIEYFGEAACFSIDAVSYAGVIVSLLLMRVRPTAPRLGNATVIDELKEGFGYVWRFKPIRTLLLFMALLSLAGMPVFSVLAPIFADALDGGQHGAKALGFIMAASGAGALIGAVYLASRRSVIGLGRIIAMSSALFGGALIAFAWSRLFWLSLLIVPFAGFGMILAFASGNTLLQTITAEDKRGRVMSFFTMAFIGVAPFGTLIAGALSSRLGPGLTGAARMMSISSVVCLIAALVFFRLLPALRKQVRPIYIEKGLLPPEVASGIQSATQVASVAEQG